MRDRVGAQGKPHNRVWGLLLISVSCFELVTGGCHTPDPEGCESSLMNGFVGVDGGGTRTVAWLSDAEGKLLARAETGPSNPLKVGRRAAEREILRAFRICLRESGIRRPAGGAPAVRAVCAGIAGVDRQPIQRTLLAWMRKHLPARVHLLTSDAVIALAAALRDAPGIILIAGTGSIALARDDRGKLLRAGGWGIPFDDRGSGYDLGRKAVSAALEAYDGRGAPTSLMARICESLRLRDITEIVAHQLEQKQVAALFPLVVEAAREGDLVARHLCDDAGCDLARLAVALLKLGRWTGRPVRVITTGGVFRASDAVRRAFTRQLHRFAPLVRVELLERSPAEGALWLARNAGKRRSNGGKVVERR